ncbi:hypothetical protein SAMN05216328_1415 [Ensifer sp. YR511]|nr:hypothetical protein SAMN05216328_1415 [Ensifer sp. YR511]
MRRENYDCRSSCFQRAETRNLATDWSLELYNTLKATDISQTPYGGERPDPDEDVIAIRPVFLLVTMGSEWAEFSS